jgi:hypothetical protein
MLMCRGRHRPNPSWLGVLVGSGVSAPLRNAHP